MRGDLRRRIAQGAHVATPPLVVMAREDPIAFCEYVLVDEQTNKPIQQQSFQIDWHEAIDRHDRVVILTSPETGKTQQITIGRSIFALGRDPDTARIILGSKTQKIASSKFLSTIMRHIEGNPRVREVFPDLARGRPWSAREGFTVKRGGAWDPVKDPSVQPAGPDAAVLGSRCTWACFDDILDIENTRTEYRSDLVLAWLLLQVESRMSHQRASGYGVDGKIALLCNAWEEYDAAHKLARDHGWHLVETPIALPATRTTAHPWGLTRWAEVWSQKRIDQWAPATAPRVIWCKARSDAQRRFQNAWINKCKRLGQGLTMVHAVDRVPEGCTLVAGVDLATRKGAQHDLTCIFVAMVGPAAAFGVDPGEVSVRKPLIRPLWIEVGRWTSPEIKARLADIHDRYPGIRYRVEDNAAQIYIVQDLAIDKPGMRVRGATTGRNKHHAEHGVEGVAVELSLGLWVIPCEEDPQGLLRCEPEIEAWIGEMLSYDPAAHTGDRLMAAWLAREEARAVFEHEVGSAMTDDEEVATGVQSRPDDKEREAPSVDMAARKRSQARQFWGELEVLGIGGEEGDADDPDGLYALD
jgi:hypothetical protein